MNTKKFSLDFVVRLEQMNALCVFNTYSERDANLLTPKGQRMVASADFGKYSWDIMNSKALYDYIAEKNNWIHLLCLHR